MANQQFFLYMQSNKNNYVFMYLMNRCTPIFCFSYQFLNSIFITKRFICFLQSSGTIRLELPFFLLLLGHLSHHSTSRIVILLCELFIISSLLKIFQQFSMSFLLHVLHTKNLNNMTSTCLFQFHSLILSPAHLHTIPQKLIEAT